MIIKRIKITWLVTLVLFNNRLRSVTSYQRLFTSRKHFRGDNLMFTSRSDHKRSEKWGKTQKFNLKVYAYEIKMITKGWVGSGWKSTFLRKRQFQQNWKIVSKAHNRTGKMSSTVTHSSGGLMIWESSGFNDLLKKSQKQ